MKKSFLIFVPLILFLHTGLSQQTGPTQSEEGVMMYHGDSLFTLYDQIRPFTTEAHTKDE
ncbi:MAG: hypothetical protein AAF206_18800 [Bacteroidota bacterium]